MEYPKALYLGGWGNLASYRAVKDAAEEEAARAEGYKTLPEWPHPDGPPAAEPVVSAVPIELAALPPVVNEPMAAPSPEPAPRRPGRPRKA